MSLRAAGLTLVVGFAMAGAVAGAAHASGKPASPAQVEAPVPVVPNASAEARELLRFLYGISGEQTLAGQHCVPLGGQPASPESIVKRRSIPPSSAWTSASDRRAPGTG